MLRRGGGSNPQDPFSTPLSLRASSHRKYHSDVAEKRQFTKVELMKYNKLCLVGTYWKNIFGRFSKRTSIGIVLKVFYGEGKEKYWKMPTNRVNPVNVVSEFQSPRHRKIFIFLFCRLGVVKFPTVPENCLKGSLLFYSQCNYAPFFFLILTLVLMSLK